MTESETEALKGLADIVMPQAPSWLPQTWGWVALALLLVAIAAWAFFRWRKRREANRYRVEALAELARLEAQLGNEPTRAEALAAIPPLLKRTALAAWPRPEVASLSGATWVEFLRSHATLPEAAARLLDDAEYRRALESITADEAKACARAARAWIKGHRVSA